MSRRGTSKSILSCLFYSFDFPPFFLFPFFILFFLSFSFFDLHRHSFFHLPHLWIIKLLAVIPPLFHRP